MGLLTTRVGVEHEFPACGLRLKAARQTRAVWDAWIRWAKDFLPDPLQVAHRHVNWLILQEQAVIADKALSEEDKKAKIAALQTEQHRVTSLAMEQASGWLAFNSPRVQSLLFSPQGASQMLLLQLQPNHPGIDADDAYAIFLDMGVAATQEVFNMTSGQAPSSPEKNGSAPAA